MEIRKIENSPEEDVAVIMSKKELRSLMKCIGRMSVHEYQEKGVSPEDTTIIQPFYDEMESYLYRD